jgi:hypothetical protein
MVIDNYKKTALRRKGTRGSRSPSRGNNSQTINRTGNMTGNMSGNESCLMGGGTGDGVTIKK